MEPYNILIVDDEPGVCYIIEQTLSNRGNHLTTAGSGEQAIELINKQSYDLILLDLNLGSTSGIDVMRIAVELDPDIVIILLTAYGTLDSAVEALRLGAFDYLQKPATPDLLRQRVEAGLAHRSQNYQRKHLIDRIQSLQNDLQEMEDNQIIISPPALEDRFLRSVSIVIDLYHHNVQLDNQEVSLTTTEYEILCSLVRSSPNPITSRNLLLTSLGYNALENEANEIIKWHIHQLRKKLEADPRKPRHIINIRYKGYMWAG